ncbi:DUF433 domain-containing protein [Dyadobacter sandarakinus]|uniref:DUF433 domain-containing protein n=1 Tax=Dyadobacter sandarakinus TaxID=2747268 RepID=A0ABX7I9L7_9BACT|nr:DUF433 domain-containing protein [Dyadobacter sandarakinus]QRR02806.1 DUF433 domain-containing protein [Dyadobacter sandarakinus]
MNYRDYISADPRMMMGKPVINGTRLTVEAILRKLAEGAGMETILNMYPCLTPESVRAVLQYAAELVANQEDLEDLP